MSGSPAAAWSADLAATPDYLPHRTWVMPPMERPGLYLVVASASSSFGKAGNRRAATSFVLSDLVLTTDSESSVPWELRLVSGRSGQPAAGVDVALYRNDWRRAPQKVAGAKSDGAGRVRFAETRPRAHSLHMPRRGLARSIARRLRDKLAIRPPQETPRP